jgi:hypothetical protein
MKYNPEVYMKITVLFTYPQGTSSAILLILDICCMITEVLQYQTYHDSETGLCCENQFTKTLKKERKKKEIKKRKKEKD